MKSVNQQMKYLRSNHGINIKSNQSIHLRNLGYYHGFKGYRYIREDRNRINFKSFDEVIALNRFDMQLKSLLYSKVMFIETALKNYVIEAVLRDSKSELLEDIFNKSLTNYRFYSPGSEQYKKEYKTRMDLKGKINSVLVRDYDKKKKTVTHFFDHDKPIPIWAIFESLTLGEFGTFYRCCNQNVKRYVSKLIKLPTNLDSDGRLTEFFTFVLKDLRNAIAHNNTIFDTRFKTGQINKRLISLLEKEIGINKLDFNFIDSYIVMIVYFLRKVGETKTSCKQIINSFEDLTKSLYSSLDSNVCNAILGTQYVLNISRLKKYISKS